MLSVLTTIYALHPPPSRHAELGICDILQSHTSPSVGGAAPAWSPCLMVRPLGPSILYWMRCVRAAPENPLVNRYTRSQQNTKRAPPVTPRSQARLRTRSTPGTHIVTTLATKPQTTNNKQQTNHKKQQTTTPNNEHTQIFLRLIEQTHTSNDENTLALDT